MHRTIVVFLGLSLLPPFAVAATPEINPDELLGRVADPPGPFVVHLNCGDGKQTAELLKLDGLVVQGLDTSRENVETARRNPALRKEYGKRITFRWYDGRNLPFIDSCVNVVVDQRSEGRSQKSAGEIERVLAPRGMLVDLADPSDPTDLADRITRKAVPADIDEWTHHMHGPDNNRVSRDTRLTPPLSHLQ